MLNETRYAHIELDEAGTPVISGTTTKVIELVLDKSAYGWGAEELHLQHPHLSLGQIYSALAYYWDHQDALDADIQHRLEKVNELHGESQPTPLVKKLKDKGLLT